MSLINIGFLPNSEIIKNMLIHLHFTFIIESDWFFIEADFSEINWSYNILKEIVQSY